MTETKEILDFNYVEVGEVGESVQAIVGLIMGVAIATLMIIFSSVLSGQVYTETQSDLVALNTTDPTSYGYVEGAVQSSFKALGTAGGYLPIVVLAIIIFIVLGLVLSLGGGMGGNSGYQGGVL